MAEFNAYDPATIDREIVGDLLYNKIHEGYRIGGDRARSDAARAFFGQLVAHDIDHLNPGLRALSRAMEAALDERTRNPTSTVAYYTDGIQRIPLAFEALDVPTSYGGLSR